MRISDWSSDVCSSDLAAIVDGAPPWRILAGVFLPLMAPALAATGLLAFILAWNEFLFALTFTLSPEQRTVPVAIALISGASAYELPWGRVIDRKSTRLNSSH